jgi:hypothetical protein
VNLDVIFPVHGPTDQKQVRSLWKSVSSITETFPLRSINLDKLLDGMFRVTASVHWSHVLLCTADDDTTHYDSSQVMI